MLLDRGGRQALVVGLVVEDLRHDHLVVRQRRRTLLLRRRETGVVEARMRDVNPGVDHADLDAVIEGTGDLPGVRSVALAAPGRKRADQRQVGIETGLRRVVRLVIRRLHLRRGADDAERGAVQLHGNGVERNVELASDVRRGGVRLQPLLEVVPERRQLGPIRLHGVAREVDLLSSRGLGLDVRRERIAVELDDRASCVNRCGGRSPIGDGPRAGDGGTGDER